MHLLNESKTDFNTDAYVVMATMLYSLTVAERLGQQMADAIDAMRWRGSFFQEKKRAINAAIDDARRMLLHLEQATGEPITRVYDKARSKGEVSEASAMLQDMTDAAGCLMLMYFAKSEGNAQAATSMLKAISNFKNSDNDVNLDKLLDFFHFNKLIH